MSIHGWSGFKSYGIQFLTGEADAFGFRGLFDLNSDGVILLTEFFGGNITFQDKSNWNRMVGDKEAVASIMLPYSLYEALAKFCLFQDGYYGVLIFVDGTVTGVTKEYVEQNKERFEDVSKLNEKFFINSNYDRDPSVSTKGGRNIHQFTGREK